MFGFLRLVVLAGWVAVASPADLHPGDTIAVTVSSGFDIHEGVVREASPERIVLEEKDGRTVALASSEIQSLRVYVRAPSTFEFPRTPGTPAEPLPLRPEYLDGTAFAAMGTAIGWGFLASYHLNSMPNNVKTTIALTGIFLGPSFGHLYAGEWAHAGNMTLVRLASVPVAAAGLLIVLSGCDFGNTGSGSAYLFSQECGNPLGWPVIAAGFTLLAGGTAYDLYDSARAAGRRDARRMVVTPVVFHGDERTVPGVTLAGRF